jgi:hypothetical protein
MTKSRDKSVIDRGEKKPENEESGLYSIYSNNNISSGIKINKIKEINNNRRLLRKSKSKRIPFDWGRVSKTGKTSISFALSQKQREKLISILDLKTKSPIKTQLVKKLGIEFARAYERYRKALQRDQGKRGHFFVSDKSMVHAQRGGERCIRKEVTPFQVFKYWHEHMSDFKDGSLKIPPLTWVASEQAIETVSCSDLDLLEEKNKKPIFGNSYNAERLDPKIKTLLAKKFDVDDLDDNYFLQIQNTAYALSEGATFFVGKKIKKMAMHLVKNYYGKK